VTDERHAYLPQPRTTARGRRVDEATRLSLMTPEEREARRLAEEEQLRAYEELRRRQRAIVDEEFANAYRTYTTTSYDTTGVTFTERYRIDYDSFFTIHSHEVNPTPPTLNERYEAALQEADRCARTGNPRGQLAATLTARRLRQEIQRLTSATII
jgi:hypothetical protein